MQTDLGSAPGQGTACRHELNEGSELELPAGHSLPGVYSDFAFLVPESNKGPAYQQLAIVTAPLGIVRRYQDCFDIAGAREHPIQVTAWTRLDRFGTSRTHTAGGDLKIVAPQGCANAVLGSQSLLGREDDAVLLLSQAVPWFACNEEGAQK